MCSAWEPAGQLDIGLPSVVNREAVVQSRLKQKSCLASRELEPNALALLPLPNLHVMLPKTSAQAVTR